MNKEELIRNLKYEEEKHKNDNVHTFETNILAMCFDVLNVLKRCIEIPEGATRADVFEIVFGYAPAKDSVLCNKDDWCGASEPCNYCMSNSNNIGKAEDYWNAPYKKEAKE